MWTRFLRLALLAALPALLACGRSAQSVENSSSPSPELTRTLTALDGTQTSLAQHQGKVVLVNFWATWCEPCRVEIPWLIEFTQKYGSQGLVVIGVAMDEEGKKVVEPYVQKERFDVNGRPVAINYQIVLGNDTLAEQLMSELAPRLSEVMEKQVAAELRKNLDQTLATLLSQLDVNVREIVRDAIAEKLKQPHDPSN